MQTYASHNPQTGMTISESAGSRLLMAASRRLDLRHWLNSGKSLALLSVTAIFLQGCATHKLPSNVDRPISKAVAPASTSPLVQITQSRKLRENKAGSAASGFLLLNGPQSAYGSRLALVEGARQTLDLQYYAIHADASTERLLRGVVDAARRGVRVRVLLDDFHGTGRNALVMHLAFVPNVQMRMFNPLPGDRESMISRMWNAATDFQRAQQRMHNKLFLADNVMGVMGGRNLGDSYFGNADSNFIDADMLVAGPIVKDMSRSFDDYWNNERAYPVQSLIAKEDLDRMRREYERMDSETREDSAEQGESSTPAPAPQRGAQPQPPDGEPRPTGKNPVTSEQRAQVWDMKPLDLRTAPLVWANAVMLVDKPSKIPAVNSDGETDPNSAQPATQAGGQGGSILREVQRSAGMTAQQRAAETPSLPDNVVDGLISLIGYAQRDLLIVSPYFVPGESMMAAFKAAVQRGVRVRVLTNSLASNDAPVAHIGYARYRRQLIEAGVDLYEITSKASNLRSAFGMGSTGSAAPNAERVMLHSKILVMDGSLLVIGSMNLDQRSKLQNTEIAALVRSKALSDQATAMIERGLSQGTWHVVLDNGKLLWKAPQDSHLEDETTDPESSLPLRMMLKIIAPLVPDSVL